MRIKAGEVICPIFKEKCIEHSCKFYVKLTGVDPNSGLSIDKYDCAIAWLPVLLIEVAQKTNQTGAEISKLRSSVDKTLIQVPDLEDELPKRISGK